MAADAPALNKCVASSFAAGWATGRGGAEPAGSGRFAAQHARACAGLLVLRFDVARFRFSCGRLLPRCRRLAHMSLRHLRLDARCHAARDAMTFVDDRRKGLDRAAEARRMPQLPAAL